MEYFVPRGQEGTHALLAIVAIVGVLFIGYMCILCSNDSHSDIMDDYFKRKTYK